MTKVKSIFPEENNLKRIQNNEIIMKSYKFIFKYFLSIRYNVQKVH